MECGKAYCIDIRGAIHLLAYLWQQVESTTVQNCFTRAKFMVRVNTSESEECADDCDSLLKEVLEHQGSAKALHFESFHDLDSDMATSPDLTESEIVATVVPREVEDDDDSDDVEADLDASQSLTAVADAVAVMRAFAEKKGLMARPLHSHAAIRGRIDGGLSNALDETEDNALLEGSNSGSEDDCQSDLSTSDSD
ncbi:hypothetical protein HPB50_018360 [Hyalomma asiaticum]|uniref:Uncharacterized protein n=1 Tax=Hyalomma asiaticum TaxID=266040 RepID=A0ACB7TPL5_HYAAI|nr:hypothetical protein HPB50_018360 [Hyalomma asiaticum]